MMRTWKPCIKLTDAKHRTHGDTQWGPGVTNPHGVLSGADELCSPAWYHAYDLSPAVALFLNPIHGNYPAPIVWGAEWRGARQDDRCLKFGATELRTVRVLDVPEPTTIQRIVFSIFVAEFTLDACGYQIPDWQSWAERMIAGEIEEGAARGAASAAWSATSAAWSATSAAWSAASAARSAASAAASAESAARSAESAAASAESAARSAESAARGAASAESAAASAESAARSAASAAASAESAAEILENAAAWAMARSWEGDA